MGYGPQAPTNITINSQSSAAQMGVSHTHDVAMLVLTGGGIVTLCSVRGACRLPGTCLGGVLVRRQRKAGNVFYRYKRTSYKLRPLVLKPGTSSYPPPVKKKTLSAHRALHAGRTAPRPRPMCRTGFSWLVGTYRFVEKCPYEDKS